MGPVKGAVDMIFGLYSSIDTQVNIICNNPMLGNAKNIIITISYQWRGGLTTKKKKFICSDYVVSLRRDISLKIQIL